ncbi:MULTISPECIES: hypothetical protein [Acidiplasma]|jgi:hypothetical protein|uniref:hypothetical protein n=1 Tax=Acidiplasma TaxID=507753 RepID=UPI0005DFC183|nr:MULTISPECIES: hypothetical protein [unclassified Acidiplasma]KJE48738.1 hypothetical protein TZ01_07455 [Acidiplasma sp. MBA-1]WMT55594.1 MAG: hypothetical protein RE470_02845 [Acidiplasma sp.]
MGDFIKKFEYLEDLNITLELAYRLNYNFKGCGYIKVYSGKIDPEEENYEIYMESLDCGMSEDEVNSKYNKMISEIRSGDIDILF